MMGKHKYPNQREEEHGNRCASRGENITKGFGKRSARWRSEEFLPLII